MDVTRKSKKIRKRNSRNENETPKKKAKINVEEEVKQNVVNENIDSEKDNAKDSTYNTMQSEFNGKCFRELLSTPRCSYALKKFVTICNENKESDLAAEYLLANGSVLEILKLLDTSDRKNADVATIFSAINILLMKILAEYPDHQNNAVESCRYLLNSHMSIIHSMLSIQSNTKQRKLILKLLAAIVSLGSNLSREVLAHLSLQQQVLENLVRHNKHTDSQSVRTCFIYFVLAFLVEGNTSVIKMLLDKNNLLSSIFPDLTYDSKDIINLVLTTVRKYVLEDINISKTIKVHAFSSSVVLNLISLYNWKGPNNRSKNENHSLDKNEKFLADKEVVNNVVHEFLLTLLTSHRYGIIFHDRTLGSSRNRHNYIVHMALQNLEKPWEHEKPSDLVIKIMKACPDLIRSQYGSIEPFLEPRASPKWICLLRFIKKIIESIDPVVCIKTCSMELTTNNLINTLLFLTVPSAIMKSAILPGLDHVSLLVRHEALTLLLAIVHQIKAIFLAAKESYKTVAVQSQITDFALRTLPNLEAILRTWNRAFKADANVTVPGNMENVQNPELVDHFNTILSILHSYKDVCPSLLDGSTDLQPSVLLTNLNNFETDNDEAEMNADKIKGMKVKAIQFLLFIDASVFAPGEKVFKEALLFLISLIRQKVTPESYDTAKSLLNVTGLFEACDNQVDIWINGFVVITDPEEYEELTKWFMSVLKSAIKHTDKYINNITQAEGTINERMANFDVKKAKDIINELFNKANEVSTAKSSSAEKFNFNTKKNDIINGDINKLNEKYPKNVIELLTLINGQPVDLDMERLTNNDSSDKFHEEDFSPYRMQASTSVSPLLCCALQKVSEKSPIAVSTYLSYVMVHSLHHQVVPELLIHMATDLTNLPVYKYLQSWLSNSKPVPLKNKLSSLRLLHKVSNMLLTNAKVDVVEFSKLFNGGLTSCCFKYGDEEITIKHSLSSYDVRVLLKMTTFYLAQLTQREIIQYDQNERCKFVLMLLLNITQFMDQENMSALEESAICIFTHPILLHYFTPFCEETLKNSVKGMVTETIAEICKVVMQLEKKRADTGMYNLFSAFTDKFLAQLMNIIEKNPLDFCSNSYDIAIELLRILPLRGQDVVNLLLALMKLEEIAFISTDKRNLSIFGHIVPVLLDISCDKKSVLYHDQYSILNEQFVAKLSSRLVHLKSKKINHAEKWEQALATFLSIFSNNISSFSKSIFVRLLAKGVTTSTIQLITTLITRNTKLIPPLVEYFLKPNNLKQIKQADVIFPILGSNLQYKWNDNFLRSLYESHGSDIVAYLTDPGNPVCWIEKNVAAIVYLIENTFECTLCEKTCDSISQSGDKLDMVSICFVQLLESLYKRYERLIIIKEKPQTDLIKILLYVMTATLKKESKNVEKLKVLCEKLDCAVICLRKSKHEFVFSSLSKSYSWPQFTRFSLKLSLKNTEEEIRSGILKTLSSLCDIAYEDNTDDEYVKTLFEMATSHSEFINVMLGSSNVKGSLVELLRILTRKNYSIMTVSHVPVYLAAYNATLSHADQCILQILQHYEARNIKIQQYWPYLWGNAAAIRYSIKGETDTALWRQPSTSEVFNLFDEDTVNDTIKNYPVHRALKNDDLYENSNVYDPAFYLPLLCSLLAENNVVACHKINHSGALALALAACCSDSSDVRMAAYTTISRYYFHLEASRSKEKLLWMRLIDALRNGVVSLKCQLKDVRLSCLVTTFLARTALVASQPLHPLYSPLHTFLMAKPALDLNTIPELLQLLHSSHVEHKAHRHWILENIRDGIKEEADIDVALKCVLFKMLLDFHTCILSDAKTKKLILEVIVSTTRIPKSSLLLTRGYGVLPWLYGIINHSDVCETENDIIITIIENLLNNLDSLTEDTTHYQYLLFSILIKLKTYFPRNVTDELVTRYTNVLQRVIVVKNVKGCMSKQSFNKVQKVFQT